MRQVDWKNRKTQWYEAVSSAWNFPCLKEVSQNCFVFDVVTFSLAELLRFGCCQVQKMKMSHRIVFGFGRSYIQTLRKSRRISSFLILQIDRQTDRQRDREIDRSIDR